MEYKRHQVYNNYEFAIDGTGRNIKNKLIKYGNTDQLGFKRITITSCTNQTKNFYMHNIIYEMFLGDIPKTHIVAHMDGNKLNNRVHNLHLIVNPHYQKKGDNFKNKDSKIIEVTYTDKPKERFKSQFEASKALEINPGRIAYYLKINKCFLTPKGRIIIHHIPR